MLYVDVCMYVYYMYVVCYANISAYLFVFVGMKTKYENLSGGLQNGIYY